MSSLFIKVPVQGFPVYKGLNRIPHFIQTATFPSKVINVTHYLSSKYILTLNGRILNGLDGDLKNFRPYLASIFVTDPECFA